MVMWSDLKHFAVATAEGHAKHLSDATLDLAGDYPRVTGLVLHPIGKPRTVVPWQDVQTIEWRCRRIVLRCAEGRGEPDDKAVRIDRDVLDALILDVPAHASMRANDLWLVADDRGLWLRAADIGPWAVLRRLGRGILGRKAHRVLVDWRDVEFLRGDPAAAREGRDYHRRVTALQPAEIGNLLANMPYLHAAELLTLLPDPLAADTLEVMGPEPQVQAFDELDRDRQVRLLQLMAPDNAVDLLARLGPEGATVMLDALPTERRATLIELLRFPDDSAGGIMTNDVVVVPSDQTVAQARDSIRAQIAHPDFVYYLFVVDDASSRKLQGVLTLRDLLIADDTRSIADVMHTHIEAVDPLTSAQDAAHRVAEQHLAALPVVAADGRLLGAITSDAALRTIAPMELMAELPRVFS
jgi:magnesium transporter